MPENCPHKTEGCPHTAEAADAAVKKTFAILGVDVDSPSEVERFREDLRFGGKLRKAADHGIVAMVGVGAVGAAAALWAGITSKITGH